MPSASIDPATKTVVAAHATGERTLPVRDAFERLFAHFEPAPHQLVPPEVRRLAFETFERSSAPGGKPGRDWKHDYTRVAARVPWQESGAAFDGAARLQPLLPTDTVANDNVQGLSLRYLGDRLSDSDVELRDEAFGSAVRWHNDKFASLAVAFMQTGLLVHVATGARIEPPILIDHLHSGSVGSSFPYTLVLLEEGAEATVVEDLQGAGFSCGLVEVVLRGRARLNYVAVQRSDAESTVLMNRGAVCGPDATCRFFVAELGGALSRSVVTTRLAGHGAASEIAGFFFNSGNQHVDLSTLVEHAVGDTTSHTTIKSAATGRGQGRYLGNIRIDANANKSDATLRDDALLLSKNAHIDSVPALEIASNDVKAFHGATVGSIDEAELFYAQSRGIERSEAERMIALGFFEPVVAGFPSEELREFLRGSLATKVTTVPLTEVS